ncbi:unnamed protein product [Prorocentrum cordatum]|nr:unnamed protein product [Polarella glacialis]
MAAGANLSCYPTVSPVRSPWTFGEHETEVARTTPADRQAPLCNMLFWNSDIPFASGDDRQANAMQPAQLRSSTARRTQVQIDCTPREGSLNCTSTTPRV